MVEILVEVVVITVLQRVIVLYTMWPCDAGWSSLAARRAHNPKVVGSNPTPATKCCNPGPRSSGVCFWCFGYRSAVGETDWAGD